MNDALNIGRAVAEVAFMLMGIPFVVGMLFRILIRRTSTTGVGCVTALLIFGSELPPTLHFVKAPLGHDWSARFAINLAVVQALELSVWCLICIGIPFVFAILGVRMTDRLRNRTHNPQPKPRGDTGAATSPAPMKKLRRKAVILTVLGALTLLTVLTVLLIPRRMELSDNDKQYVVRHAVRTVLSNRRVWTTSEWAATGYRSLNNTEFVKANGHLFFQNDLGIPDDVFIELGLKPAPKGKKRAIDHGDVLLYFSQRDWAGKQTETIQFVYVYGSLGAHAYEITVRRSLLMRYLFYTHAWCS